jgi:cobalt-zinc-cadmium efflux system protein
MSHPTQTTYTDSDPNDQYSCFCYRYPLNTVFVVTEFSYGLIANSTVLMADAGHNLSDVLSLLMASVATILSKKTPNGRFTYGLRSSMSEKELSD